MELNDKETKKESGTRKKRSSRKNLFQARGSRLDTDTIIKELPEFRGFITMFWISLFIFGINTVVFHYKKDQTYIRLTIFNTMSKDLLSFFVSEFFLVLYSFTSFFLHKAIRTGICSLFLGSILKHLLQTVVVLGSILWSLEMEWNWPQTMTFTLHAMVIFMKMHSYLSTNYYFEVLHRKYKNEQKQAESSEINFVNDGPSIDHSEFRKRTRASLTKTPETIEKTNPSHSPNSSFHDLSKDGVEYPENITLSNFVDFLLVPTLVYELKYPRTDFFRFRYLIEKIMSMFGGIAALYFVIEYYIYV
jgi:sterol O-acyltransferase